jgi:hypothetical protein
MILPLDRISGKESAAEPGWTGRWFDGAPMLDTEPGGANRDNLESDDLDTIAAVGHRLAVAVSTGSWEALRNEKLVSGYDIRSIVVLEREKVLAQHLPSIEKLGEKFFTRLTERVELLPVARARKPARRAFDRLAGHTEDWAARTLAGPVPRRVMAVMRDEEADLYENRMVTELVHPILSTALRDRIEKLHRLKEELSEIQLMDHEGFRRRTTRLYELWRTEIGGAADDAEDQDAWAALNTVKGVLLKVQALARRVGVVRGSTLAKQIKGRRTGSRGLRRTNAIDSDPDYRGAGLVWKAYERPPDDHESAYERAHRLQLRHAAFDDFAFTLVLRALESWDYRPADDRLPTSSNAVALTGRWGVAELGRGNDGVLLLTSHGRRTRIVPVIDLLARADSADEVATRWSEVTAVADERTVVLHLTSRVTLRDLPGALAQPLSSAGRDELQASVTAVPVSPLEITSLERVARAVGDAVLTPALEAYPVTVTVGEEPLARRLVEYLDQAGVSRLSSPLFWRDDHELRVRRPPDPSERGGLQAALDDLRGRTRGHGWERHVAGQIERLGDELDRAFATAGQLLLCPGCGTAAVARNLEREGDLFTVSCSGCGTRWGHDRCGNRACRARIPVIEPGRAAPSPSVTGPGWVERVYGQEALASPCWARSAQIAYVCPSCRVCQSRSEAAASDCVRCAGLGSSSLSSEAST